MDIRIDKVFRIFFFLSCAFAVLLSSSCQTGKPDPADVVAIKERNEAIRQLVAQTDSVLQPLRRLDEKEKNAVAALLVLSKAVGSYESVRVQRDDTLINAYYGQLDRFSEKFSRAFDAKSFILSCVDETVSCLVAREKCLKGDRLVKGKSEDECDSDDPDVISACGNEAACILSQFLKIDKGIPDILGGGTPWPPQPKPF